MILGARGFKKNYNYTEKLVQHIFFIKANINTKHSKLFIVKELVNQVCKLE